MSISLDINIRVDVEGTTEWYFKHRQQIDLLAQLGHPGASRIKFLIKLVYELRRDDAAMQMLISIEELRRSLEN